VISDFIALRRGISPNMQQTSCPDLGNIQNMSSEIIRKLISTSRVINLTFKKCLKSRYSRKETKMLFTEIIFAFLLILDWLTQLTQGNIFPKMPS